MRETADSPSATDTIVAVATPPGRGGIGIVRLSGPDAVAVAGRLVRLPDGGELAAKEFHARARRAVVLDPEEPILRLHPNEQRTLAGDPASAQDDNEVDRDSKAIDEALVTVFHAPHSYTGEDVVEIAAHGSPVVMEALVRGAIASGAKAPSLEGESTDGLKSVPFKADVEATYGLKAVPFKADTGPFKTARLAAPGEFTQRAFLAGRIDLTQAEAVGDLIAAQTLEQARAAAQQLGGALSRCVTPAKEQLLHLIALLEAGMDFASGELDDVDIVAPEQIAAAIERARTPLQALDESFHRGQLLRHGAAIALVGRPNAGKSSLFNRLLERERAIVTPLPGTTRDTVEESLALGGVPVRLVDTAGIRASAPTSQKRDMGHPEFAADQIDEAERQGIVRSREALADADLVLLVRDATLPVQPDELALLEELADRPHLVVENKCDLLASGAKAPFVGEVFRGLKAPAPSGDAKADDRTKQESPGTMSSQEGSAASSVRSAYPTQDNAVLSEGEGGFSPLFRQGTKGALAPETAPAIRTSALTGNGIDTLREAILRELGAAGSLAEGGLLNNLRQQEAVSATLAALDAATDANHAALPHEILLLELHNALRSLDSLTGETTSDDILARIFATFCIGK